MDENPVKRNQALLSKLSSGQGPSWLKKIVGGSTAEAGSPGTSGFPGAQGIFAGQQGGQETGQAVPATAASGDDQLWKMTVLRGGVITTQTLSLGDEEKDVTVTAQAP